VRQAFVSHTAVAISSSLYRKVQIGSEGEATPPEAMILIAC
jgi:hypothetical protein